jgi:hypothetical protein
VHSPRRKPAPSDTEAGEAQTLSPRRSLAEELEINLPSELDWSAIAIPNTPGDKAEARNASAAVSQPASTPNDSLDKLNAQVDELLEYAQAHKPAVSSTREAPEKKKPQ